MFGLSVRMTEHLIAYRPPVFNAELKASGSSMKKGLPRDLGIRPLS